MKKQYVIINKGKGVLKINPTNLNKVEQPITEVDTLYNYVNEQNEIVLYESKTYTDNKIVTINNTIAELDTKIDLLEFPNEILVRGGVTIRNEILKIEARSFVVRINQRQITNPQSFSSPINVASEGYNRIDIIVINEVGVFTKIQGEESLTAAIKPEPLINTLEVAFINITSDVISDPIKSDTSKLDRGGYTGTAADLEALILKRHPYNEFKFVQKGFGNTDLTINEIGDIFCGWKDDGTLRYPEAKWNGGSLNTSTNFTPILTIIIE